MINGKTCLVGLLGKPVNHSLSPVIQNAALNEMGLDWCYLALPCESQDLSIVSNALLKLNCKGLNITIPHKQSAIALCEKISPIAEKVGAINTLIPNNESNWNGTNTDIQGFLAPIQHRNWTNSEATVLGCGGSAKAVIAGLQSLNFKKITMIGRREIALKNFILDIAKRNSQAESEDIILNTLLATNHEIIETIKQSKLVVNTTPVGMSSHSISNTQELAIPLGKEVWQHLTPNTTLYDLIYTPNPTAWLTLGEKLDCETIDGLEMLIQQGAASLKLWSKKKQIPIEIMRKAAKEHLSL